MVESILMSFAPMLLGAQLVLTLVLVKGDICPGQRGRVHKMLPAIGVLWLAVASIKIEAFLVVFAIFYFFSKVQTNKTRDKGPLWLLYLANGLALAYVGIVISEQPSIAASIVNFAYIGTLGAIFAQLLLLIARSRLDAFHRILPVAGVLSGMLVVLATLLHAYSLNEESLALATQGLLISFALLIIGIVIWCWHLFLSQSPNKLQLTLANLTLLAATIGLQGFFIV
ncbi:hypothetical protein [Vibrio cortegadensis]|uniref:hypothetical protein n=1 Tax=Vibrio cortegadensis TaxID=1328770 RepID=UPI00352E09DE